MTSGTPDAKGLAFWVIYNKPSDYPNHFVVRRQRALPGEIVPEKLAQIAETLEEARKLIPPGLYCLGRFPDDDPVIVESWI